MFNEEAKICADASAPFLTLAGVCRLGPCKESYRRVSAILPKRGKITARQAVDAGCTLDDLTWVAFTYARKDKSVERRLRHWEADCATRVLHIYERAHPGDARVRDAIIATRQFADGEIGDAARRAAWAAARRAAWAARGASSDAEEAWQLDRLVYWLSEDKPEPLPLPAMHGGEA